MFSPKFWYMLPFQPKELPNKLYTTKSIVQIKIGNSILHFKACTNKKKATSSLSFLL